MTETLHEELGRIKSENDRPKRGRPARYTPEERVERAQKAAQAQQLALSVLRQRHKEEYDDLYAQAKEEVGL